MLLVKFYVLLNLVCVGNLRCTEALKEHILIAKHKLTFKDKKLNIFRWTEVEQGQETL